MGAKDKTTSRQRKGKGKAVAGKEALGLLMGILTGQKWQDQQTTSENRQQLSQAPARRSL